MQLDDSVKEAMCALGDQVVILFRFDEVRVARILCAAFVSHQAELDLLARHDVPGSYIPGGNMIDTITIPTSEVEGYERLKTKLESLFTEIIAFELARTQSTKHQP